MARIRFNRAFNVNRVVKRLVRSVLALYVGGVVLSTVGDVLVNTSSVFYLGTELIGWSVGGIATTESTQYWPCDTAGLISENISLDASANCITSVTGSGVLAVVGIIAIAQIITEFIAW